VTTTFSAQRGANVLESLGRVVDYVALNKKMKKGIGRSRKLTEPGRKDPQVENMARGLINLPDIEGGKDSREPEVLDLSRVDQFSVKHGIEIPHNSVGFEDGVLRTEPAARDFVKAMTHELRTPLNVIIGLCQLLERDRKSPLSETQRDAVDRMERNARALLVAVNHLLGCLRSGNFD
jgi:signal transduction histidine kinase